jgi:hypothetical protein
MNVHDSTIIGLAKENRPATKNRRVNVEQGIMNIEGEKTNTSKFDILSEA